jgi:hypothetical protein
LTGMFVLAVSFHVDTIMRWSATEIRVPGHRADGLGHGSVGGRKARARVAPHDLDLALLA